MREIFNKKEHEKAKESINQGVIRHMQNNSMTDLVAMEKQKARKVQNNIDDILRRQDDLI